MSMHLTISWRLVPDGAVIEPPVVQFAAPSVVTPPQMASHSGDQVLPLGSSVVAPGLAVLLPA